MIGDAYSSHLDTGGLAAIFCREQSCCLCLCHFCHKCSDSLKTGREIVSHAFYSTLLLKEGIRCFFTGNSQSVNWG